MIRTALYAPWPERARSYPGAASIAVAAGFYALSSLPVIIGAAVYAIQSGSAGLPPRVMFTLLLAQFVLWGVLTALWTSLIERRGLPSLGVQGRGAALRLLTGAGIGAGLIVLTGMAALAITAFTGAAPGDGLAGAEGESVDMRAIPADFVLLLAFVALVFLIQGAVEEWVFRGWLMSALTARWGVSTGVLVSSLVFMIFHAHVFVSGLVFGAMALATIGAMGMVFALISLTRGSILEAAGAHGVFNAIAVTAPALALYAASPDQSGDEVLESVFSAATGMAGEASGIAPQMAAQLIVMAAAALILLVFAARARSRSALAGSD